MRDALVFNGASNLDFLDIRTNVIRIPEVVTRIREAQSIWDTIANSELDLANFIASEDNVFLGNIHLKSFATAVVQVGLLDRYLKNHGLAEFLVGAINGDSPLRVALGQISFFDMVAESAALTGVKLTSVPTGPQVGELPMLAGVQLVEYAAFRRDSSGAYQRLNVDTREIEKMILGLVDAFDVRKLVMVGPGNTLFGQRALLLKERDLQLLETIDLDPMLSWFWSRMKESRLAIAN
jgi:hypothetical protein